jgi:hypothetical protein
MQGHTHADSAAQMQHASAADTLQAHMQAQACVMLNVQPCR